jgi:hypothetical protein
MKIVLTDEQKAKFVADIIKYETGFDASLFSVVEAIEQAVLQSPEVQGLRNALQEVVDAADGEGWNAIDPSFEKQRAALAAMGSAMKKLARATLQSHKPKSEFEDPRVQLVYGIICGGHEPPEGEHWDGYVSRLIVDALQSQHDEETKRLRDALKLARDALKLARRRARGFMNDSGADTDSLPEIDAAIDQARRAEGDSNADS